LAHALDLLSDPVQDLAPVTTPNPKPAGTGSGFGSGSIGPSIYGEAIVPTTTIKEKEKCIQQFARTIEGIEQGTIHNDRRGKNQ
jgi:hypothetical protein